MLSYANLMDRQELLISFVHHFMILAIHMVGVFYRIATWYGIAFQMLEWGNIPMHLTWFMETANMKSSPIYLWNGIVLLILYILLRVFWTAFVQYLVLLANDEFPAGFLWKSLWALSFPFTAMQFYFTGLVVHGMVRFVFPANDEAKKNKGL